jgi:cardiolipin synthase
MHQRKISLIVQPGDSFFPIVEAIDGARRSINITIFRMDDPVIQQALLEAAARGVRVRALVAANPRGWQKKNRKLLRDLLKSGIETKQPPADSRKARYHYKILTVDGRQSLILTFNPTRENLHYTRDFGIILHDEAVTAELDRLFDADWNDTEFTPDVNSPLVISPYNSRGKIEELLRSATSSVHIADAKLRDYEILNILMSKAASGVGVKILGSDRYYSDVFSLLKFRQITRFKLHAKCLIVDGARAVVGSANLRYESLDKRREVGIIVDDESVVARIEQVFTADWDQKPRSSSAANTVTLVGAQPPVIVPGAPIVPPGSQYVLLSRRDAMGRHTLRPGETTIGRADDNDIVVLHPAVSRYHARIAIASDTHLVTDLESQNGTFLNGQEVKGSVEIGPGDVLGIADADDFRFMVI